MADERDRYFRRLRRLRRSARRWSVLTGLAGGAAVVLLPYHGLGWPDAVWAAATGASTALTWWRWSDLRELAAQPAPEPVDPAVAAARTRAKLEAAVLSLPIGRSVLGEMRRMQSRSRVRGSSVATEMSRLDRAARSMAGLVDRLTGPAAEAGREAVAAERGLRELGERTAAVERAMAFAPGDRALAGAHAELAGYLGQGIDAYERLVGAAAGYVAQDSHTTVHPGAAAGRLAEATDLLRGIADGLAELRTMTRPV